MFIYRHKEETILYLESAIQIFEIIESVKQKLDKIKETLSNRKCDEYVGLLRTILFEYITLLNMT